MRTSFETWKRVKWPFKVFLMGETKVKPFMISKRFKNSFITKLNYCSFPKIHLISFVQKVVFSIISWSLRKIASNLGKSWKISLNLRFISVNFSDFVSNLGNCFNVLFIVLPSSHLTQQSVAIILEIYCPLSLFCWKVSTFFFVSTL